MTAKILAYSRSRGVFAGATLEGTAISSDEEANEHFYGVRSGTKDIVLGHGVPASRIPEVALDWRRTLARLTKAADVS